MEVIIVALIGVAGTLGGILLSHYLSKKDVEEKNEFSITNSTSEPVSRVGSSSISRTAILSFIFGLAGLIFYGIFFLVAIVSGHLAVRAIHATEGSLQGIWLARAGLVMGYVGVIYILIIIIGSFIFNTPIN